MPPFPIIPILALARIEHAFQWWGERRVAVGPGLFPTHKFDVPIQEGRIETAEVAAMGQIVGSVGRSYPGPSGMRGIPDVSMKIVAGESGDSIRPEFGGIHDEDDVRRLLNGGDVWEVATLSSRRVTRW